MEPSEGTPNSLEERLAAARRMLERSEKREALARKRMKRGYDPADAISCDFEWGSVDCHQCIFLPECELWLREQEDETSALLQAARQGYRAAEQLLRTAIQGTDDPAVWQLWVQARIKIDQYDPPTAEDEKGPVVKDEHSPLRLIISRDTSADAGAGRDVMLTVEKGDDRLCFYRKWDGLEDVSMRECFRELQAGINILKERRLRAFSMEFTDAGGRKKDLQINLAQNTEQPVIVITAEGETTIRCAAGELYRCVIEGPWN